MHVSHPTGSGKSTLLRVLLGLESVVGNQNTGTILINGCDVTK
jgi:ABC-type sugar transport system ATPase subunit